MLILGWAVDGYAGGTGGYTSAPPPLTRLDDASSAGLTPNRTGSWAAGLDAGLGVHRPGRFGLDLPLFELRAVDLGKHRTTGLDAQMVPTRLDLDEATIAVSVLGIGGHVELGRLLVRAAVRPALEWSVASGTITQGVISNSLSTRGPSFAIGADADLEICGLVTRELGICVKVTPRLSRTTDGEHGLGNGAFFGVGVQTW